jgi:uncharacterized protein YjbJ (UPF0337 family)
MGEMGDKLEGEVKDAGGKVTGDKKMEWEGKAQKVKGDLEGAGNDVRNDEPVEGDKNL